MLSCLLPGRCGHFRIGSTLKEKNLLPGEQILSFKSRLHFGMAFLSRKAKQKITKVVSLENHCSVPIHLKNFYQVLFCLSVLGAHAPSKPHINVIGRNELHVSWNAPEVPLGRFNRYDLLMDDKIVYSGVDLNLTLRRLTPDTEYSFVVSVFDFD